jgi:hypothetical protein
MLTAYRRQILVGLMLAGLLPMGMAGCGRDSLPTYRAGGKVVFPDGKPLEGGWVCFESVQGGQFPAARGQVQPDGSFQLSTYRPNDGAVEGEFRALVTPPPPEGGLKQMKSVPMVLDPRFSQFDTSGLKFTVTRDPAKNQFTLQVDYPHGRHE